MGSGTRPNDSESMTMNQMAQVLAAMGNPIRLGILLVLYGSDMVSGTPCLRYSQIKEITGIASDSALTYHLGRLIDAELISKDAHKDENNEVYPIYSASSRWNGLIELAGLRSVINEILTQ